MNNWITITIFLINFQSIKNKIDELTLLIKSVNFPEYLLLTEHWLYDGEPLYLFNYTVLAQYSRISFVHGGTVILIRNDFSCLYKFMEW